MKVKALWLTLAGLLILAFAIRLYRGRTNSSPIEPHAAEEIEKAKRR
jgi:transcriptional regulator